MQPSSAERDDVLHRQPSFSTQRTFPNRQNTPTLLNKLLFIGGVANPVSINLAAPEVGPRRWQPKQGTVMSVPEAAMRKDNRPVFGKHDVRTAGMCVVIDAEPKAKSMQAAPQRKLKSCVL